MKHAYALLVLQLALSITNSDYGIIRAEQRPLNVWQKARVACSSTYGQYLVYDAVVSGNLVQLKELAAKGVDVTKRRNDYYYYDGYGNIETGTEVKPSLPLAVGHNDIAMVRFLLDMGATAEGLETAARLGNVELVRLLLDAGARDYGSLVPAIQRDHLEVVRILLDSGIKLNRDEAILWASRKEDPTILRWLLDSDEDYQVNVKDEYTGDTPLLLACRQGSEETVRVLLDAGASMHIKNSNGQTPLDMAAATDKVSVVDLLLKKDLEQSEKDSALYYAVLHNRVSIVDLLLKAGADPNYVHAILIDKCRLSYRKGQKYSIAMLSLAIERPYWVRLTYSGYGPEIQGFGKPYEQVVELLLKAGANRAVRDADGYSPLDYARQSKNQQLIEMLQ